MQKISYKQDSFAWGEIDPLLKGRTDLEQYRYAVEKGRNVFFMPQGAARRRPGLKYLATIALAAGKRARIIPFQYSTDNAFLVIIHGNGSLYIYDTSGTLQDTLSHPYADTEIDELSWTQNLGRLLLFHQNYAPRNVRFLSGAWGIGTQTFTNIPEYTFRDTNATFYPGVDHVEKLGLSDWAATDEFTIVVDGHETAPIAFNGTPATTAANIQAAIEALSNVDSTTVSVAASSTPTSGANSQYFDITMSGNNGSKFWSFEVGQYEFAQTAATTRQYIIEFTTITEGKPSQEPVWGNGVAATETLTLTGNVLNTETVVIDGKTYTGQSVLTNVDGNFLIGATASDSLDNLIAAITLGAGSGTLYAAATTLHPTVTAAAGAGDTMDVTAKSVGEGGNSIAVSETLTNGSWGGANLSGGRTKRGWPRCGIFFQGRWWMGGSKDVPTGVWASRSGQRNDFDTEDDKDDFGIFIDLNDDEVSTVNAFSINRHLQIFSSLNEHYIPKSDSDVITPTNASARRTTQRGSKQGLPVVNVDGATLFIDRTGRQLREFLFQETEQAYTAENVQRFAGHIYDNAASIAYKRSTSVNEPDYVFVVDRDLTGDYSGDLAVFSILRGENISGWSKCTTFRGGAARYGADSSGFWGVAVVDEMTFVLTKRDLTDALTGDTYYLEMFDDNLELDSGSYGDAAASVSGLSRFNAYSGAVAVVDGNYRGAVSISGGSHNLDPDAVSSYQIGLNFPAISGAPYSASVWLKTLPVPVDTQSGSSMPKRRRSGNVFVRVKDTPHMKVNGEDIFDRLAGADVLDQPMPEYTGVFPAYGESQMDYEAALDITQDLPFPMFLLSIAQEAEFE